MAKGNLFLGTGRGSIGDVTMYRKNGEQISRVRVRKIKNPSSNKQLIQRAVIATVAKAYAAGSAIFDHSFEGVSVGARSQALFMQRNIDLLRSYVVADIEQNRGENASMGSVVARKGTWPVPNAYQVSQGSLIQDFITTSPDSSGVTWSAPPYFGQDTTLAQYLASHNIVDDDIFTIVAFGITDSAWEKTDPDVFRTSYECHFGFLRMRVKTAALSSTTLMSEATFGDAFEMESTSGSDISAELLEESHFGVDLIVRDAVSGSLAVIRSRENSGLRSTSYMELPEAVQWGIVSKYITEQWSPDAESVGDSSLILEGGGL